MKHVKLVPRAREKRPGDEVGNIYKWLHKFLFSLVDDSNLFPVNARLTKAWDSRDELRDMRVLGSETKGSLR